MLIDLEKRTNPRGISIEKKNYLMKMIKCMPLNRQLYYKNLHVNEDMKDDFDNSGTETYIIQLNKIHFFQYV